jgi:hypothetical protein
MCDSVFSVKGVKAVDQVLDEQLAKPEEQKEEEEEVSEDKLAFLNALKELEAARKYICEFDAEDSIIII